LLKTLSDTSYKEKFFSSFIFIIKSVFEYKSRTFQSLATKSIF